MATYSTTTKSVVFAGLELLTVTQFHGIYSKYTRDECLFCYTSWQLILCVKACLASTALYMYFMCSVYTTVAFNLKCLSHETTLLLLTVLFMRSPKSPISASAALKYCRSTRATTGTASSRQWTIKHTITHCPGQGTCHSAHSTLHHCHHHLVSTRRKNYI